ncbi:MAG: FliM/FliN family flagellar motor C-terminal domain-containing protein [Caulobacterales bacterium]
MSFSETLEARPYVPIEALHDGALADTLAECARAWAHRWFYEDDDQFVRVTPINRYFERSEDARYWRAANGALILAISPDDQTKIAASALNLRKPRYKPAKSDLDFIANLGALAIIELLNDICEAMSEQRSAGRASPGLAVNAPRESLYFALSAGPAVFHLYCGRDLACRARKALTAPALTPAPLALTRTAAISDHVIFIGARVGQGKMGFAELSSLAVGDVFVTDRNIDDPIDITINGELKRSAGLRLVQDGSKLELRITETGAHDI